MEIDETKSEPNVLHERLTLAEWHQNSDTGLPKISLYNPIPNPSFLNPWRIFEKAKLDSKKFLLTGHPWHLAVGQDGKIIAIVQESIVEIRISKDDFSAVVGKALIPVDQYPHLRKVQWSTDNIYLAVARDNGIVVIFNLLGYIVATIMPCEGNGNIEGNNASIVKPVAGLAFFHPRLQNTKWSNELYIFYNDGHVRSILLSSLDGCDSEENAKCSLDYYFPQGITAVTSYSPHYTVILAGNNPSPRDGLSVWRVVNDYPYFKIGSGFEKDAPGRSFLRFFQGYSTQLNQNAVITMKICPQRQKLACLHYSGDISLWQYPGIQLIRRWPLSEQPNCTEISPQNSDVVVDKENFLPVDICWWSDTALAIARKSGALTVCSITTLNNLLGKTEVLLSSPRLASLCNPRVTVLALECETENNKNKMRDEIEETENENETSGLQASIQAALYSFTDMERFEPKRKTPRVVHRTYRLVALKCATPEELYKRKIELEDYDSALSLARSYNLDCDLVYQKQWKSSPITEDSIYNYLDKIRNKYWVVNECLRGVPDNHKTARKLLNFGLKKTDGIRRSLNSLTYEQKQLIPLRRQLLSFLDSLILYQKILTGSAEYNAEEYDNFRKKSALVSAIDLARQENWLGVSVMLTYNGNSVAKYWLPILSNFPETLSPLHYRSLLPELNDSDVVSWNTEELRTPDWSENLDLEEDSQEEDDSKDYLYDGDRTLKQFEGEMLESALVSRWYLKRVYEIEKNTGMVENAYLLACLGRERNVKSLDTVLFHLRSLYTLVYTVQDMEITLTKLESLPAAEQAKLFFSKTTKETFVTDLNNCFYPFAKRYEKRGICTFYSLLHGVLLWLGQKNLDLPLKFFQATKEEGALSFKLTVPEIMRLAIRCIYSCKEPDQLENDYLILECLPARTTTETVCGPDLHNTIDKMENHLQVCEILQQYKIFKPVIWVVENKENRIVARQIMQQMANYTRDVTQDYTSLQSDLHQLQSFMFTSYDIQCCNELIASTQLNADNEETILLAKNLMQATRTDPNKIISFGSAVELVVTAARRHFEKADSFDDPSIKLARLCLSLIREPHKHVKEQIDLIEGLRILKDFGVRVLPMQVQNCRTKMALIERCLLDRPFAYRSKARLIQLADCLRLFPEQKKRECSVILILAKYALKMSDFDFCNQMCNQLIAKRYPGAWSVVRDFVKQNKKLSYKTRQEFLAFALLYCPKEKIQTMAHFRRNIR